jgi:hypothetical protein
MPAMWQVSGNCQAARPEGTAVPKDTHRTATTDYALLELPEQVTLAVAELAGAAREGCWRWPLGRSCRCCRR